MQKVAAWRARLAAERRLKVALVWTGNATHQRNPYRAVGVNAYAAAFKQIRNVAFYSLQFDAADQVRHAQANGFEIVDHAGEMKNYDDSAAFMRNMDLVITICTSAPSFLFEGVVGPPLAVRAVECDVGLVQKDALTIDEAGTTDAVRRFLLGWDGLVSREARWLRESGARLVLGDIPPLAFAAAADAGVLSIAFGNFSWDWIYSHLAARQPGLAEAADHAARVYARAGLLLRLPFAGDLSAFPRIEDVPLVARAPELKKAEARRRLGLDARPVVLLSFGGVGMPGLDPAVFGRLDEYLFLLTGQAGGGEAPNVRRLQAGDLSAAGLFYPDLVAAADIVVSKPGYGIVTDCIGARTRLIYTDRGDFPEYPVLVSEMPRYLPVAFASNADIRTGRLDEALRQVMTLPLPEPPLVQ
jgi:L-arabinokinase